MTKLKDEEACIGDVTSKYTITGEPYTTGSSWYYDAYKRLAINGKYSPSLECNGTKATSNKIYPLTADEIAFAGGKSSTQNYYYYLNENAKTGEEWLTLTRSSLSAGDDRVFSVYNTGSIGYSAPAVNIRTIRPSITLIAGTTISGGIGTQTNPYVIS